MFARSVESIDVLTRRAQDGDSQAFEAVYRQTSDRVYALCLRMSGDADRAAELVQDVFVRVWERSASFRGDALFTTWLHRLTVNVVLQDRQRGAAARRAKSARRVLVLQDVQGYKYNEIAQMTGVSLGTVKAQIHRARGLVKEALA